MKALHRLSPKVLVQDFVKRSLDDRCPHQPAYRMAEVSRSLAPSSSFEVLK